MQTPYIIKLSAGKVLIVSPPSEDMRTWSHHILWNVNLISKNCDPRKRVAMSFFPDRSIELIQFECSVLVKLNWFYASKGLPGGLLVQNPLPVQEMQVQSLSWEDPLEKEGNPLQRSWLGETPWTEAPGRPQSVGSQRSWTRASVVVATWTLEHRLNSCGTRA